MALNLGRPWTPYQQLIGEVAGEIADPATGTYAYHTVVVLLPRQSGKTTVAYDSALGRGRLYRDYRARYTTHQGTITTARFNDWFLELERYPRISRELKLRRSQGTEGILRRDKGSYFQAFPPRDGALRSAALDLVIVDEAQEHDDTLGEAMRRTITPTFSTRPRRQLWIVFTAGTDASTYAMSYLAKALAGTPGFALFDYGCPDDIDPLDRSLWHTWHPGLAYGLTDYAALDMALEDGAPAFIREYGNRWTRTAGGDVVDPADWAAVQDPTAAATGPACIGFDVDPGRGSAAIVIADNTTVELVDQHDGTDWLISRLTELQTTHRHPIACTRYGAAGPTVDALEHAGAELLILSTGDAANAAAGIADAIETRSLKVRPSPALTESVEGAAKRDIADTGGFVWARRDAAANPAPLIAASYARWGALHAPDRRRPVASMGRTRT
jgi:hypothetical protein